MTRDDCLSAISNAFGGAKTWASTGYWDIKIESTPPRTIVLTNHFVEKLLSDDGMTKEDFGTKLSEIPKEQWTQEGDRLLILLRDL